MERKMEYKIGLIQDSPMKFEDLGMYHKFIVAKEAEGLVFHSARAFGDKPFHNKIAEKYNVSQVMGGGAVKTYWSDESRLFLMGGSTKYGAVPPQILQRFPLDELLEIYKKIDPRLKSIEVSISREEYFSESWNDF